MKFAKLLGVFVLFLLATALLCAQHTDLSTQPATVFGNDMPKNSKSSKFRIIQGIVKDKGDNPVPGAIVQLKDLRTSKVVAFATKDDGKFAFRDLRLDVNYELLAKHEGLETPVKKVTIYDTRNQVIINFKLEPPAPKEQ